MEYPITYNIQGQIQGVTGVTCSEYALNVSSYGTSNFKSGVAVKHQSYARYLNRLRGITIYPRNTTRFQGTESCCNIPTPLPKPKYGNKRMNLSINFSRYTT